MAVLKAKPEKIVDFFLGMLQRELQLSALVTRVGDDFFKGAKDDTVTLRIPGLRAVARDYEFRTRTAPIVLDDIQGGDAIAVKLDTHSYSATGLTDEHMTLDDIDFAREVLQPQVNAVVGRFEGKVLAGFLAEPWKRSFSVSVDQDPLRVALEARRLLDADKVAPREGRFFLVGSDVEAAWLASDRLSKYESTGQTGTPALREAIIGRIAGSPVVSNLDLPADYLGYHHKSALVLGVVAPDIPQGAVKGRRYAKNGLAVRWIQDYDANFLRDRSVVSSFLGLTGVRDERDANGDLLPEGDPNRGVNNVRGLRITVTGTGTVLQDTDPATPGDQF